MEGWVGLSTMSVNNLLKVVTRQRSWWDLNPRPLSHWSEILPTPPSHVGLDQWSYSSSGLVSTWIGVCHLSCASFFLYMFLAPNRTQLRSSQETLCMWRKLCGLIVFWKFLTQEMCMNFDQVFDARNSFWYQIHACVTHNILARLPGVCQCQCHKLIYIAHSRSKPLMRCWTH